MTVYIAPRGTPLSQGGTSATGHMHYNITDDNGVSYSYGFAPLNHGEAFGPGHVYTDDAQNYQSYQYKREVPITNSQFQNVLAWSEINKVSGSYGNYAGLGNNCIDFTYDAMKAAGINPTFEPGARTVLPAFEGSAADKLFFEYMRRAEFNREGRRSVEVNSIAPVNTNFNAARNWPTPRDPLVLDLDNDGIETLAINPAAPILFDMDADGVKTGTGWIKPDDALVVLDRNGNGLIDSGAELFGDSTVLQNGPKAGQKAANGFEALADLSFARISMAGKASNVNRVHSGDQTTGHTQVQGGRSTRANEKIVDSGAVSGRSCVANDNTWRKIA